MESQEKFNIGQLQQLSQYLSKAEIAQSVAHYLSDAKDILKLIEKETENTLNTANLEKVKRSFHTLKGNSSTLGASTIAQICQTAEDEIKKSNTLSDRLLILQRLYYLLDEYAIVVKQAGFLSSE